MQPLDECEDLDNVSKSENKKKNDINDNKHKRMSMCFLSKTKQNDVDKFKL
jgi:hypothetical protein